MNERQRSTRRRLLTAAVVLAAVTPLAACGSGGGASTAVKANSSGLVPITVLRSTGGTFEPLVIAQEQGYFKAAGLDVTIKAGAQNTAENVPSVIKGEAQFAMTDGSGFLSAAAQNLPVKIVTGLQSSTTAVAQSDGLLVEKSSPITSLADLAGKTVALPALGGNLQFLCEYGAKQAGIDPSKIKFVQLPTTSLIDAVNSGKVDAAFTFAAFYSAGLQAGLRVVGKGSNALPDEVQALLFSSTSFLTSNAATAKKFIDAVAEGITYANAHPDAVRAVDTQYTKLSAAYIKDRAIQPFSKTIDSTVYRTVINAMYGFGLVKATPADSVLYWDEAPTSTTGA